MVVQFSVESTFRGGLHVVNIWLFDISRDPECKSLSFAARRSRAMTLLHSVVKGQL